MYHNLHLKLNIVITYNVVLNNNLEVVIKCRIQTEPHLRFNGNIILSIQQEKPKINVISYEIV